MESWGSVETVSMGVPGKQAMDKELSVPRAGSLERENNHSTSGAIYMPGVQLSSGARETDKGPFPQHTGWEGRTGVTRKS